jgi:hypothetical protein
MHLCINNNFITLTCYQIAINDNFMVFMCYQIGCHDKLIYVFVLKCSNTWQYFLENFQFYR